MTKKTIVCPHCSGEFVPEEHSHNDHLICPHCQSQIVMTGSMKPERSCPNCDAPMGMGEIVCVKCGYDKSIGAVREERSVIPWKQRFSEGALSALVSGFLVSLICHFSGVIKDLTVHLSHLVHNFGHVLFSWFFGCRITPGSELHQQNLEALFNSGKDIGLMLTILIIFAYFTYTFRKQSVALIVILSIFTLYNISIATKLQYVLIIYMGQGTELLGAAFLLYRVFKGATIHKFEVFIWSFLAFILIFHNISICLNYFFAGEAVKNLLFLRDYETLVRFTDVDFSLGTYVFIHLVLSLLTLPATVMLFLLRHRHSDEIV